MFERKLAFFKYNAERSLQCIFRCADLTKVYKYTLENTPVGPFWGHLVLFLTLWGTRGGLWERKRAKSNHRVC